MREIKFRAWDKNRKKMWSHSDLYKMDCSNEYPFLALIRGFYATNMFPGEEMDVIPMQFTGLEDYAGDDIYEGDIVEVVISNKPKRFEVFWDECGAMFLFAPLFKTEPMGAIDFYELEDEYGKVIVIGNKFENPELLEGTV